MQGFPGLSLYYLHCKINKGDRIFSDSIPFPQGFPFFLFPVPASGWPSPLLNEEQNTVNRSLGELVSCTQSGRQRSQVGPSPC